MLAKTLKLFVFFSLVAAVSACAPEKKLTLTHNDAGKFSFPAERSYHNGSQLNLYGNLQFPEGGSGKLPAMIILHGSAGQGYRDRTWSDFFLKNGIATFQVDYLSPRGLSRGSPSTAKNPYDVTAAVKFLSTHPRIDPARVGAIGFSRGGTLVISTLQFSEREFGGHKLALNVNLYGNCFTGVSSKTTDAPVLVIVGDNDVLVPMAQCEALADEGKRQGKDIRLHVMPGGTHAFDDNQGGTVGWGGKMVTIAPNSKLAAEARRIVLEAAKEVF